MTARRLAVGLAVLAAAVAGPAGPVAAHGDEVVLEVVEAIPSDEGSSVTYRVALTYANDGDGIDGATVTATAFPPTGDPASPQAMVSTGAGGLYEGTVAFPDPGRWRVQFDVEDPAAQVSATYRVVPPPPPETSVGPTTTLPPPTSASVEPSLAEDDSGADDDGPPVGLFVALAVAALLFVGAAVYLLRRGRRPDPRPPGKDQRPDSREPLGPDVPRAEARS